MPLTDVSYAQSAGAVKHSDSLVVISGVKDPTYVGLTEGRQQLTYESETQYPAGNAISFISKELRMKGWKPLQKDFLNPGLSSSHVRGRSNFEDATQHPALRVYQWLADWENRTHDVVVHNLEYSCPASGPLDLETLHVTALYIPAHTVTDMKRTAASKP